MNPYEKDYNLQKGEYDRLKAGMSQLSTKTLTPEQQKLLLSFKDRFKIIEKKYFDIKKQYESWAGQGTVGNDKTSGQNITHIAPNGKQYLLTWDGKQASFVNVNGQRVYYPTVDSAKAYINSQNPVDASKTITQQAKVELDTGVEKAKQPIEETKKTAIEGQNDIQAKTDVISKNMVETEMDINNEIKNYYTNIKNALDKATDLEVEAQTIYGEEQINAQMQDLIKKGLNPYKAKQAALFTNLKGRANLSAKISTIKADAQKTIADLEAKKTDLIIKSKTAGVENQKWALDQAKNIEANINSIKNQYNTQILALDQTYKITPLLDVYSATLATDVKNAVQNIQNSYDTSSTQGKIAGLARVLGDAFAYIDGNIYNFMNLPFDQLLVKAVEIVRKNSK